MARIRFIEKKSKEVTVDRMEEFEVKCVSSNIPAVVVLEQNGNSEVLAFSYTGSTETIKVETLQGGVDVSTGAHSGRIIKVEGPQMNSILEVLKGSNVGNTPREKRNYQLGVNIIETLSGNIPSPSNKKMEANSK